MTTRDVQAKATQVSGDRLLEAAIDVIRAKGYSAARVEDICAAAGLTKGAFFHHFASKEACAIAAAAHFAARADALFDAAPYSALPDPAARALGYIDFRKAFLQGELPQFTCLLGTMVQEAYETHPSIRQACDRYISEHADRLVGDLAAAKALYAPKRTGGRRAWRCTRRPCCRAPLSSPRPSTALKSPSNASTISGATSRCCSARRCRADPPKGAPRDDVPATHHPLPVVQFQR